MGIREDIKHYQDIFSYASSKVDCSMEQNIYILPGDMNFKIKTGTVGYNNNILVSDEKFSLGKNESVNLMVPTIRSQKVTQTAANSNDVLGPQTRPRITRTKYLSLQNGINRTCDH